MGRKRGQIPPVWVSWARVSDVVRLEILDNPITSLMMHPSASRRCILQGHRSKIWHLANFLNKTLDTMDEELMIADV